MSLLFKQYSVVLIIQAVVLSLLFKESSSSIIKPPNLTPSPAFRFDTPQPEVQIVLVGEYTKLEDSYISVIKALRHAALTTRNKQVLQVRVE